MAEHLNRSLQEYDISLHRIRGMLSELGATQIYVKELAPNDNSKNQPYLGKGDLKALNIFPAGEFRTEQLGKRPNFKAPFPLWWVKPDGRAVPAPRAQLIVYPKYPEVRMSGFLKGVAGGPNALMTTREPGRLLLLGVTEDRRVLGWVSASDSAAAREFEDGKHALERLGIFWVLPTRGLSPRSKLLDALLYIHQLGWVDAQRLGKHGIVPCRGTNCGGCTLEALLGVSSNSAVGPDYEGWEIKGHRTANFGRPASGPVTLMTPAPTSGLYKAAGLEAFMERYGYPDRSEPLRQNFSSPHRAGTRNHKTSLTLEVIGFDQGNNKITDAMGSVALLDPNGEVAASWRFADLMTHWNTKHARAAFVPYMKSSSEPLRYSYSPKIDLAEGTDFGLFLKALASGLVAYDPGTWRLPTGERHERSQFRIPVRHVHSLYHKYTSTDLVGSE